jgi:hypothetical protein
MQKTIEEIIEQLVEKRTAAYGSYASVDYPMGTMPQWKKVYNEFLEQLREQGYL